MKLARRGLMAGSASSFAVLGTAAPVRKRRPRFGLADITVMRELTRDYAGTLRQIAAMGYTTMGSQLAGYGGRGPKEPNPAEKAWLVRGAGLEVGVVRLGVRNVDYDRDLDQTAETGAKFAAITTAAPFMRDRGFTTPPARSSRRGCPNCTACARRPKRAA
jgi:hypothetical protein